FVQWNFVFALLLIYAISAVLVQRVYSLDDLNWQVAMDALARYLLAIPGVLLASLALWRQRSVFLKSKLADFVIWLNWSVAGLLLYGVVGQIFTPHSAIFPANLVNSLTFMEVFGFPVQLFRAILACIIAVSLMQVLRALEVESQENIRVLEEQRKQELELLNEELRESQIETEHLLREVQQRSTQRGNLLMHITNAQEAERQRIARELHDDTGQVLTALAMGLRGLAYHVEKNPERSVERLLNLEKITTSAIADLRHLINDLRPPQLDDMGLVPALRSMRDRLQSRDDSPIVSIHVHGDPIKMNPEAETTLYRIAQEAVTNAIKHADAKSIDVTLDFVGNCKLTIHDDGKGFDVQAAMQPQNDRTAWGLFGIMERARLIDAVLEVDSQIGSGTTLSIQMCAAFEAGENDVLPNPDC
ncbi:MAG: sensor histidine kinase, partial [Anaerolineae bacterium]|nr:sensor histidine kinase [Anaerolineae bacterium]